MALKIGLNRISAVVEFRDPNGNKIRKTYGGLNPVPEDEGAGTADLTVVQEAALLAQRFDTYFWSTTNVKSLRKLLSNGYSIESLQITRNADMLSAT